MSSVRPQAREILFEAYPARPDTPSDAARGEANRDRVLITLLALNFLLMAFFAVMTSIAAETRTTVLAPADGGAASAAGASAPAEMDSQLRMLEEERRRAVDLLRASVAQVFAPVIAAEETWRARTVTRVGADRVDIEVPFALFAQPDHVAEGDALLAGIAGLVTAGVRGYRTELALRASHPETDVALLAQRLLTHGLAPSALSVGLLKPVHGQAGGESLLRFTFLLLEGDDDVIARLAGASR